MVRAPVPAAATAKAANPWTAIAQQAIDAAQGVLGRKWGTVVHGATIQIKLLTDTAQYIAEHKEEMSPVEYKAVIDQQKLSLQAVLLMYEEIGIVLAQQAVAQVWQVIGAALKAAVGIVIK
jgi:hypothetical protein